MARGYPDFYGYQIVPKYGMPTFETKIATVFPTAAWENVFNIAGKGRSYGGHVFLYGVNDVTASSMIRVTIDGVVFTLTTPAFDLQCGLYLNESQPFLLTYLEHQTAVYLCAWQAIKDWTFGLTYVVDVFNGSGVNAVVRGDFTWGRMI